MNMLKKISILLSIGITYIAAVNVSHADEMKELMASPGYADDVRLSNELSDYFLRNIGRVSASGPYNDASFKYGYDAANNANLWMNYVKPECNRLTDTYQDAYVDNVNDVKGGYEKKLNHSELRATFSDNFDTSVFRLCESYKEQIKLVLSAEPGGFEFDLERTVKAYTKMYDELASETKITLFHAFKNPKSGRHGSRIGRTEDLRIIFTWLDDLGVSDRPAYKDFKVEYERVRDAIDALMEKYRGNEAIESRSVLPMASAAGVQPSDLGEDTKEDNELRTEIALLFNDKYRQKAKKVLIRGQKLDTLKRLVVKSDKLFAEDYTAMPFMVLVDRGNDDELSTHRGWYEIIKGGKPAVYLYPGDDNFNKLRVDQFFSTIEPKTIEEKRAERDAAFEKENAADKAATKAQIEAEVAAAKKAAEEETARALADAQKQIDDAQSAAGGAGGSSFSLMKLLSAIALILGGVMAAAGFIAGKLPENAATTFNGLLDKVAPFRGIIGFVLLGLGALGVIMGLIGFSVIAILFALVSVAVGVVLSDANVLGEMEQTKTYVEKAQEFAMPVGLAGLALGLLSLVGII